MKPSPQLSRSLHSENHPSYQLHRKQVWTQILLPILLTVIAFIAVIILISVSAFRGNGDVSRWAAISTIWLVIPLLLVGLIVIAILFGLVYLLARVIGVIPPYSHQAQRFVYQIEGYIQRGAEFIVKPVLFVDMLKSQIQKVIKERTQS
jgi:heme/copper-type cytochrome/quinol oxidase subunit 2